MGTGGRRGIGLATAKAFLAEGAKVAICARGREAVDAVVEQLRQIYPGNVLGGRADVRQTTEVRDFVEQVATAWGGVDILVNNAGESHNGTIDNSQDCSADERRHLISLRS